MKKVFCLLLAISWVSIAWSQQTGTDSIAKDSLRITEDLAINQQQKRLDSLIRIRLEKELSQLSGDSKQKAELQKQLRQIAVNDSLRTTEQKQKIELLKATAKGYPVTLLNDTLFYIYLRLGSFNPAERAEAISARINRLYEDEFFKADTLHLVTTENTSDIVYQGDMVILSVTELDALYHNQTPQQLAADYLQVIKTSILKKKEENSFINWVKRVGYASLVILGFFIVIFVINRLFLLITRKMIKNRETYFKGIHFKSYNLFDAKQHLLFFLRILGVAKIVAILFALYFSLPLLFSIFPQTKAYTQTLLNWIISPARSVLESILDYLPNLFTVLVIYLFTRYAIKGVHFLADEISRGDLKIKGFYSDWAQPTFNIVRFLLYAFMVIIIFPYLPGSGSPAFQGVSVFLGILFSLGSSSAIANIVAGLVITYMRPFKVGDRVKIGEITGDVLEKTLLVTRIQTIKNEEITVPNASVLSNHTTNFTNGAEKNGLIVHTSVTIGYDVPWQQVHNALIEAAIRTELIQNEPKPFVLQTALEDFYVAYQVNAYTKHPAGIASIYSELHRHIQDCFNEAGIEILSPHYRAVRDGNTTTIPEDYLPADYKAPSFRVESLKE